jgi:hypothetical protein
MVIDVVKEFRFGEMGPSMKVSSFKISLMVEAGLFIQLQAC